MIEDFGHRLTLDRIRDAERIELTASEDERRAIAARLDLERLDRLDAHVVLGRDGDVIRASGRITASADQRCVVTGEPVPAYVDEAFAILFRPEPKSGDPDEEVELQPDDCDVVFYEGGAIDLGTAVADTLALALEPYPRSAAAESTLREAGVLSEEEAGPFAVLAQLKKRMSGDEP